MLRRLTLFLLCVHTVTGADPLTDPPPTDDFLDRHLRLRYSQTSIFDTHPANGGDNTGNLFNFVPHGHLVFRHSALGFVLTTDDGSPLAPGDSTAALRADFHLFGVIAENEPGEAHHILAKVIDRNYIEPALRRLFRRKPGEILVYNLDRTVVDRISDRVASEVLSRIPANASIRRLAFEFGHVLDIDRTLTARVGLFQPSYGAPRDDAGRSLLDRAMVAGPDIQYRMSHPSHTLAAELAYSESVMGRFTLRLAGGIHQAQDPDPTLGKVFRNAVFDEGTSELSPNKVDELYLQAVISAPGAEFYGSVADSEGSSLAAGVYYRFLGRAALAVEGAYHNPDSSEFTRIEKLAETIYRQGISGTFLYDVTDAVTAYVNLEAFDGSIGERTDFAAHKYEVGFAYRFNERTQLGLSTYRRKENEESETGFRLSMALQF